MSRHSHSGSSDNVPLSRHGRRSSLLRSLGEPRLTLLPLLLQLPHTKRQQGLVQGRWAGPPEQLEAGQESFGQGCGCVGVPQHA